jgi:hypothetical protein
MLPNLERGTWYCGTVSVVAGDRLDGCDHLLVRQVLRRTREARVASIQKQSNSPIGVPTERGEKLAALSLGEGTKVHRTILLNGRDGQRWAILGEAGNTS